MGAKLSHNWIFVKDGELGLKLVGSHALKWVELRQEQAFPVRHYSHCYFSFSRPLPS